MFKDIKYKINNIIRSKNENTKKSKPPFKIKKGMSKKIPPTKEQIATKKLLYKSAKDYVKRIIENINKRENEIFFEYNRIFIKNQKTMWGSCSIKKNLNFNYKIIYLPNDLANYLVVHELCHLTHFNHSKNFWALVKKLIPNYKKIHNELKKINVKNFQKNTL